LLSLLLMFNQLLWIREIRPRSKRNKIHTIEFWISQKDTVGQFLIIYEGDYYEYMII
jgi:hypothetical protein